MSIRKFDYGDCPASKQKAWDSAIAKGTAIINQVKHHLKNNENPA